MQSACARKSPFILFLLFSESLPWKCRSQACPLYTVFHAQVTEAWLNYRLTLRPSERRGGVAKPQQQFCFTATISCHVKIGCKSAVNNGYSRSIHSYTDIPINNHAAFTYWTNISQHLPCAKHNPEPHLLTQHKHLYHATYAFSVTGTKHTTTHHHFVSHMHLLKSWSRYIEKPPIRTSRTDLIYRHE